MEVAAKPYYPPRGSSDYEHMRNRVCILSEDSELPHMWKLMYDDNGRTMPISFVQCEEFMDKISMWKHSPDNWQLAAAPGVYTACYCNEQTDKVLLDAGDGETTYILEDDKKMDVEGEFVDCKGNIQHNSSEGDCQHAINASEGGPSDY